jgi:hypothetical protein
MNDGALNILYWLIVCALCIGVRKTTLPEVGTDECLAPIHPPVRLLKIRSRPAIYQNPISSTEHGLVRPRGTIPNSLMP